MTNAGKRRFAAFTAVAAMALMPAAASAQAEEPFAPVHHIQDVTSNYNGGLGQGFAFVLSELDRDSNTQTLTGTFNNGTVVGVVFNHTWEKATDSGSYSLIGTLEIPDQLPVPVLANISAKLDRTQGNYVLGVEGKFGDQPIQGVTRSFTNPFYAPLS